MKETTPAITPVATPKIALELTNITKRFGNVTALDGASITVRRGTIHALLGENGAGKTTLMRIAFDTIKSNIGMVHQHFTLVPSMTVAENVALGGHGRYDRKEAEDKVKQIGEETGLTLDPSSIVGRLPVSAQQRVEIVKALARNAQILILDEPTAVLAPAEVNDLLKWLRNFANSGGTVVLITHKLREALSISDHITVLRRGKTVLVKPVSECTVESLAEAMLGKPPEIKTDTRDEVPEPGDIIIEAKDLVIADERGSNRVREASFTVRSGEIVGIAGVEGSGQYHLIRALAGRSKITSGVLSIPYTVGFIPEDRHKEALVLDFDLSENVALKGASDRKGVLKCDEWEQQTFDLMQQFDVRGASPGVKARTLSGGNQQKLVVGRELKDAPRALIVENPTRGLDVQASTSVHNRLRAASRNGAAVVVYSSDIDEVLALANRALVVFNGIVKEVPISRQEIGLAMLGVSA